ncbi:MAG TPA: NADH-quinone oxidoreductase subunit C [Bacteroidales bacterium]|nr:NADH-quinone oxidoreductase subunit C [Bacteroidales bacterium]
MTNKFISVKNNEPVPVKTIPELTYKEFTDICTSLVKDKIHCHIVNYFGYRENNNIKLICCIADDQEQSINVLSTNVETDASYPSLTIDVPAFDKFEREVYENFGVKFEGHPWLKPVRYPFNRANKQQTIENYPFLKGSSEELHEVGVGPIHAGVIEPGHFRFICHGEQILHLEIQLGYQHRGVEQLMLQKQSLNERITIAESIAGDSAVEHATAFAQLWESLCNIETDKSTAFGRSLAQEIERIAIHTGDMSAICTDIAYQLGSAVFGRLRTPMVNFFQEWCGNRLCKGLIRVGGFNYPFTEALGKRFLEILTIYERDFEEMATQLFKLPSALGRLERTGVVENDQIYQIGAVGMAARMSNLKRDIRMSHPYANYKNMNHQPVVKRHGDVYSRTQIRKEEIRQSIGYIRNWINNIPEFKKVDASNYTAQADTFVISLTEGWRGEVCHCAITDNKGMLKVYKIKDPSFHNWKALELAVRNNEISDFPICNKSFNLSYCGHDL